MRTQEQIEKADNAVKKAIGKSKKGKGFAEIAEKLPKLEAAHIRSALVRLRNADAIVSEGSKRYTRYFAR